MMKLLRYLFVFIVITVFSLQTSWSAQNYFFHSSITQIPVKQQLMMQRYTWHTGCPVPINNLDYLQLSYWGFDNKTHQGILIVNQQLAPEVVQIFHKLFLIKFPIAKMQPLDVYQGNDEKSMEDNNTVAFNCRTISGYSNLFSLHSYGRAIDINPLINPSIKNGGVLPPQGSAYVSRNKNIKGIIVMGNSAYNIFIKYGWQWGGEWRSLKDYQHFEKAN